MKYRFSLLIVIVASIFLQYACDEVDPPYKVESSEVKAMKEFPALPANPNKIALLEEFTGHKCPNCPAAAEIVHELHQEYEGQFVSMAIHSSSFGSPGSGGFDADYRTAIGLKIEEDFSIGTSNPAAMFNRTRLDGGEYKNNTPSEWEGILQSFMDGTPSLYLQVINEVDTASKVDTVFIKTSYLENYDDELFVCAYLIEDSVISQQITSHGVETDYAHMEMLRGCINTPNSPYGTLLSDTLVAKENAIIKAFTYTLDAAYVAKNCHIVAFVYDNKTKEVIQAAIAPYKKED